MAALTMTACCGNTPKECDKCDKIPVALQLYSVRDNVAQDFYGTLKAVKEMGYDGVEFRRRRAGKDETPEQYLDEIGRWSREYGLRYVLFGGPGVNAMTPDRALIRRELDDYKRFLDLASSRVELSILNFFTGPLMDPTVDNTRVAYHLHGSFCAQPWHWESAAAVCQELADYAAPLGVKFAFETHMSYLHDIAESAKKLCDMIDRPNFGINLDYGNTQYFTARLHPWKRPSRSAVTNSSTPT